MSYNLSKRVGKLEALGCIGSAKIHFSVLYKFRRLDSYPDGFVRNQPSREACKNYGRNNIEEIKKQRAAKKAGYAIDKWIICVV